MFRATRPRGTVALCAAVGVLAVGCGAAPRQDVGEPAGRHTVEIVDASFPSNQKLAKRSFMTLTVRNVGATEIPHLSATVQGFSERNDFSDAEKIADPERPVFALNRLPEGSESAYVNTYSLGRLRPGQTKSFTWDVTAVDARPYRIRYRVSAGLDGKATAVLPNGQPPAGQFAGTVERAAPTARVAAGDGETIIRDGKRIGPEKR